MNDIGHLAGPSLGLILILGGLVFVASRGSRLLRARQPAEQILTLQSTVALTPQCSVAVVRTAQEELILGLTAHNVTILTKTALTPPSARSDRGQVYGTQCRRGSRRITAKTRRLFSGCQYFTVAKPSH